MGIESYISGFFSSRQFPPSFVDMRSPVSRWPLLSIKRDQAAVAVSSIPRTGYTRAAGVAAAQKLASQIEGQLAENVTSVRLTSDELRFAILRAYDEAAAGVPAHEPSVVGQMAKAQSIADQQLQDDLVKRWRMLDAIVTLSENRDKIKTEQPAVGMAWAVGVIIVIVAAILIGAITYLVKYKIDNDSLLAAVKAACSLDPNSAGCKAAIDALSEHTKQSVLEGIGLQDLPKYLAIGLVAYLGFNMLMTRATMGVARRLR